MSDLELGGLGILFSRLNGESMYLDTTVSVEPSSLKLDSDYSLIYEYIIDDINCSCFEMPYCHGFCNNDHICNCLKSYWSVVARFEGRGR